MYVSDDEAIRRTEQVFYGDPNGKFEFGILGGRVRAQALFLGLAFVAVPAGFQVVSAVTAALPIVPRGLLAVFVGGGSAVAAAYIATRVYARYDRPQTRVDYYAQQAWLLVSSPRPPGPPVEHDVTRAEAVGDGSSVVWATSTPPPLSDIPVASWRRARD